MRPSSCLSWIAVTIGFAIAVFAPTPSDAAEIKVLTSRAMNHVLTDLGGEFQRSTGHKVTLTLAPPTEIAKRVISGELVDVVMSGVTAAIRLGFPSTIQPSRLNGRIACHGERLTGGTMV